MQEFYTVENIKNMLTIGLNKAYNLVKSNGFPSIKIGNKYIVPKDEFENALTEEKLAGLKMHLTNLNAEKDDLEMHQLFDFIRANGISLNQAKSLMGNK